MMLDEFFILLIEIDEAWGFDNEVAINIYPWRIVKIIINLSWKMVINTKMN